ncbi:glycosyltransferase family 2 protein [Geobacter sp. AOG1]|uniref:glycosyltransferase family 2 protein n=1 Tax=Geobacter sp. AOG1 TaxID=1566346 RepID=UPI001CC57D4F|nr:glycosyltransferase family 2 protein [Geobacter sp. AOG1]GFE57774.1 glycosyl transferase [Geobacter sp. AOG1]
MPTTDDTYLNSCNSENGPLVTVIIAVFNGEKYIAEAINSITNQTYADIELIVIDGDSKDSTVDILRAHSEHIAYWVSEPDSGIYDAWNKGLAVANGEWIAFLGCDDLYYPTAIKDYVEYIALHKNEDLDFVSSRIELVSSDLQPIKVVGEKWSWEFFRKNMIVAHPGSLHNRKYFSKYGIFDPTYRMAGDYELLLRAHEGLAAGFLDNITVMMRVGGASTDLAVFKENYRAKTVSGERNKFICYFEEKRKWWSIAKYRIFKYCFKERNQ